MSSVQDGIPKCRLFLCALFSLPVVMTELDTSDSCQPVYI